MLGPLPHLHRLVVIAIVLLTGMASGAWIAHFTPLPVAAGAGALVGALAGLGASYLLVHRPTPQPARPHRR